MLHYFTLSNGLRIVVDHAPAKVDYFGIMIQAGSRDEAANHFGLAHFVEHTIFKGTLRRRATHIINRMEAVGGELNAYTTKEETVVYSVFPHGNLARAAELIADLVVNSRFPSSELDKEREVVRDEIDSYLDVPAEAVFDDFEDLMFANSQLGHNILGTSESLNTFQPDICREYIHKNFHAGRMVAFYRGSMSAERVRRVLEHYLSIIPSDGAALQRVVSSELPLFEHTRSVDSHQAHCVLGAYLPSLHSNERFELGLITNILGGPGMNSRLNVALREKRGLVYSVDAGTSLWSDCGLFTIYFGSDPEDAPLCRKLVLSELEKIATVPLTDRQLVAARRQYLGQLMVSTDNHEQMAINAARATCYYGEVMPPDQLQSRLEAITPSDILAVARYITPQNISSLTFTK